MKTLNPSLCNLQGVTVCSHYSTKISTELYGNLCWYLCWYLSLCRTSTQFCTIIFIICLFVGLGVGQREHTITKSGVLYASRKKYNYTRIGRQTKLTNLETAAE